MPENRQNVRLPCGIFFRLSTKIMDFAKRRFAMVVRTSLLAYQPSGDAVGVTLYVRNFYVLRDAAGEAVEGLVREFFRRPASLPGKKSINLRRRNSYRELAASRSASRAWSNRSKASRSSFHPPARPGVRSAGSAMRIFCTRPGEYGRSPRLEMIADRASSLRTTRRHSLPNATH